MIEREIEIGGKPLKIYDLKRQGVVAITTKTHLKPVFNDKNPQTNTSYVDAGEAYAVMSFGYTYGGEEDLDLGAQIKRKFNQWYYGVTSSNMLFWYRGLYPMLNKDRALVLRLNQIVGVDAPDVFRIKKEDDGARDFADAVFANRDNSQVKKLIWKTFKGQRTFDNFKINLDSADKIDKGTINVAFQFVAGKVPQFAGIKIFGSLALKKALKTEAMAFYRGFIAPHMSIFESRMRDAFMSGNFTINRPQTLGQIPSFTSVFEEFGRTASQESLRTKVIRLAHQNPELRKDLLPLLKEASRMPHDKALTLRILNSRGGKAYGLVFADAYKSKRNPRAVTYEFETNIQRLYSGHTYKRNLYIDVETLYMDKYETQRIFSVYGDHDKKTWEFDTEDSERELLQNLPMILAYIKKQLG